MQVQVFRVPFILVETTLRARFEERKNGIAMSEKSCYFLIGSG